MLIMGLSYLQNLHHTAVYGIDKFLIFKDICLDLSISQI